MKKQKKKILIGEDDNNIVEILKMSLEPFGYEIIHANNGEDTCMRFVKDIPDLIILDILMPKMNGFQVCEWIRNRDYRNNIPIIMISGIYRKKEQQEEAINKYGASDFIIKPFRIDYLLEKIRFHLKNNLKSEKAMDEDEEITLEAELQTFSYKGSFTENPVEILLNLLFKNRETGKLVGRKNKLRIHFYFRNGNLVFAQTNIKKFTPAYYFYKAEKLDKNQYHKIEKRVKAEKRSREEIIREEGFMSDDEIKIGMSQLFQEIIYLSFTWESGDYYFVRHREPRSGSWQLLQSTANLIMGGMRRLNKLERVKNSLPEPQEFLAKSQNPFLRFQDVSLKSDEKQIFSLIDGKNTYGIIENSALLISSNARNIIYAFLVSGLVEITKEITLDNLSTEDEEAIKEERKIDFDAAATIQNTGGNLLIEPLPELFFDLYKSNFTGEVAFENQGINKFIHFKNGNILFAGSNQKHERLGNVLFELKRIDQKRFTKALRYQSKNKEKKIGTILLDLGFLSEDQLKLALQLQVKKIILNLFEWQKGSYIVQNRQLKQQNEDIKIFINTPDIILEGMRNIVEVDNIKRFLPKDEVFLKKVDDFDELSSHFDLTEGEQQILRMIDGKKNIAELISIFKIGRTNIYGFIYGLYTMKLVEIAKVFKSKPRIEEIAVEKQPIEEEKVEFEIEEPEIVIDSNEGHEKPDKIPTQTQIPITPNILTEEDESAEIEKEMEERERTQDMFDKYYKICQRGDYYNILKLDRDATTREIKLSFRKLAKQFHPDTIYNSGIHFTHDVLNEIFLKINEANQVLTNKDSRERYDRERPEIKGSETLEDIKLRADMAFQEGLKQMRINKPLEATDSFREAIRLFPKKSIYHTKLVEAYLNAKVPPVRVIRSALEAVNYDTNSSEAHYILGKVYFLLKDYIKARKECDKALELNPNNNRAKEILDKILPKED